MKILDVIIRDGKEIVVDQNGIKQWPGIDIISMDNWDEPLQYRLKMDFHLGRELVSEIREMRAITVYGIDNSASWFTPVIRNEDREKGTLELAFDTKHQMDAFEKWYTKKA